jgi:hypothetical protein
VVSSIIGAAKAMFSLLIVGQIRIPTAIQLPDLLPKDTTILPATNVGAGIGKRERGK